MPFENPALFAGIETYNRIIILFSIIILVLMFFLCLLFLAIRKAQKQEQQSKEFSNLVIEGLETERRRISRELHDTILPQLQGMPVSDQIRSICVDLMPPDFSRLHLKDALSLFCAKFQMRTGIKCACFIEDKLDFSIIKAENQLHIYRMVQESFNNIEKHSKASNASLIVRHSMENMVICISDDGPGLSGKIREGLGIKSIRQRAVITGSKLDFISEAENGFTVIIELPSPIITEIKDG